MKKGQRRAGPVDEIILSLYARGLTTRDIQAHLEEVYGASVSPALISNITDVVQDEDRHVADEAAGRILRGHLH